MYVREMREFAQRVLSISRFLRSEFLAESPLSLKTPSFPSLIHRAQVASPVSTHTRRGVVLVLFIANELAPEVRSKFFSGELK